MNLPDAAFGLPAALVLRLVVIVLALLAIRRDAVVRRIGFVGAAAVSLVTLLTAATVLRTGTPLTGRLFTHSASGYALGYTVDPLAAWFLLVVSVLAVPIAVFSLGYVAHPHLRRRSAFVAIVFNALLGSVEMVLAAGDAVAFLFAWELMTLATAALVATEHEERATRRAAYLYLVMSHVGTGCLIGGFLTLAAVSGSLSFSAQLAGVLAPGPLRDGMFALFLVGFGLKAGIIPLHVWLPEAHPAAPTSISALMSAVLIKMGVYGIVRVCAFGLGVPSVSWGVIVLVAGGLSAVLGVLYALVQHDLKRLLAYHSIENIGIILLGVGAAMIGLAYGRVDAAAVGMVAGLYHVLNHAVFKGLLFLGAGSVVMATGTRQIERFGGLLRRMPWTGLFFLVGAMAISGLPPLNGFASEWLTFQAFLFGFRGSAEPLVHFMFPVGGALLALTTALAAACFVKAFGISFLALPRSREAETAMESPAVVLVPQAILALLCVALGTLPGLVVRVLSTVAASLPRLGAHPEASVGAVGMASGAGSFDQVVPAALAAALLAALVFAGVLTRRRMAARRVPTWGCGGELTASTEYTATAFSKPLMMIFRGVYRPTREVEALAKVSPYYPQEVRYRSEVEPTFERYVYGPLVDGVLRLAQGMKVVQAGSVHAYLAYVTVLVVSLVLMVWWTS